MGTSDLAESIECIKTTVSGKLIYLASPYSHDSAAIRQWRFDVACKAAAMLMRDGLWVRQDRLFLDACGGMIVLTLPGWERSKGVIEELQIAVESFKPIWFLSARLNRWPEEDILNHDTDWIINP